MAKWTTNAGVWVLIMATAMFGGCAPMRPSRSNLVTENSNLAYDLPTEKPGFVISPYAKNAGYVDVRNAKAGEQVRCPYTGGIFIVPKSKTGVGIPVPSQTILPAISPQFICDRFKAGLSRPLVPHSEPLQFASGGADPKFGIKTARWLQESDFRKKIVYRDFYYVSFFRVKPGVDSHVTLYAFGMKDEKQARDYMNAISPSAKIKSGGLWTEAPQSYSAMAVGRVLCVMVIEKGSGFGRRQQQQDDALLKAFEGLMNPYSGVPVTIKSARLQIDQRFRSNRL